jgi:hypothetical protein
MTTVQEILRQIDSLDEHQRLELDRQLAEREQGEWQEAAREMRDLARQRGIDQAAIDQAVERRRYGRSR